MYGEFDMFKIAFLALPLFGGLLLIMNNSIEQNNKIDMLITAFQIQNGNLTLEQARNLTNYPLVVSQLETSKKTISSLQSDLEKSDTIRDSLWANLNIVAVFITGMFGFMVGVWSVWEQKKKIEEEAKKEKEGLLIKINEFESKSNKKKK